MRPDFENLNHTGNESSAAVPPQPVLPDEKKSLQKPAITDWSLPPFGEEIDPFEKHLKRVLLVATPVFFILSILLVMVAIPSFQVAASTQVPIPDSTVKNITLVEKYPSAVRGYEPTIVDQDGVVYNVKDVNVWNQLVDGDTYQIGWQGDNPKEVWGVSHIDKSWVETKVTIVETPTPLPHVAYYTEYGSGGNGGSGTTTSNWSNDTMAEGGGGDGSSYFIVYYNAT